MVGPLPLPYLPHADLRDTRQAFERLTRLEPHSRDAWFNYTNSLFADQPSGEILYIQADNLPAGGQDAIRRILLNSGGEAKTLLQVIQEKNAEQGRSPAWMYKISPLG